MDNFFYNILYSQNRKIVIHHAYDSKFIDVIRYGDVLFFDDCLYSQYEFIFNNLTKLIENDIQCVLGFSSGIHRPTSIMPISNIDSSILHAKLNSYVQRYKDIVIDDQILAGFMTIAEIKRLLSIKNIHIALHGCCHLNLKNISSKTQQMSIFSQDLSDGLICWKNIFGDFPHAYVFPYAYEPFLAQSILKRNNIYYSFAGNNTKRISIEDLIHI